VPAKVIKLVGPMRAPFLSPINLITFAGTQNGEKFGFKEYMFPGVFCLN
jgi:hypothetical protein